MQPISTYFVSFFIISGLLFAVSPLRANAAMCKLSFSMVPKQASIVFGETITYAITVKNIGSAMCRDVSYSLFYAPNETYVSAMPLPRASNYYWYVGNLGVNKLSRATVTTKHVSETSVVSEGCASGRNVADACASATVTIAEVSSPIVVSPEAPVVSTTTAPVAVATTTTTAPVVPKAVREHGMWVWNFPSQMNTATGDAQMKALASYGFNAVYITIDDYLDIAVMPEGAAKESAKKAYFAQLAVFVQKANALGMQVDTEGGANNWAIEANRWKGFALIEATKEYNRAYPNAKVRGFQYDVEPYTLPDYETNKAVRLTEFVTFIDQSMSRLVGSDVQFSVVIPHFYDSAQAWTPTIAYGGKSVSTFTHLLSIMEKKPGGTILLMSYRDFFEGANGTRGISEVEIKEASVGYSTNIIVSQETGNVEPDFVTFYGSSKTVVLDMLTTINTAFDSYSRYGGTATHYMDSFLEMK